MQILRKNLRVYNLENKGARELAPLLLSNDLEICSPERHKHNGRSKVVHHVTGKLSLQECDTK
jgi:hypothetical protein